MYFNISLINWGYVLILSVIFKVIFDFFIDIVYGVLKIVWLV